MKELEKLDKFPFVQAKNLVGFAYLGDHAATETRTVPVKQIVSAVDALSWKDTMSRLPSVYVEQLIRGEMQPNSEPPFLLPHDGVFVVCGLGWKVALAKLNGLEEIEALILCYD